MFSERCGAADRQEETITGGQTWKLSTLQSSTGNVKTMTVKRMPYPNRYNIDTVAELAEWFHPGQFGK
ncbi:hypothetical protein [Paenibacillus sp. GCM10012303]|uniref:hypothetical protein n=1 Tax=Paenibacillus sp. GCM10012303 TaxID=3317340 RepID=UPI0036D37976